MLCIIHVQLHFCRSPTAKFLQGYIILVAEDLLNSSIMCVTDRLMDLSSIYNCLKPLRQLTVITYGEKLDVSSIMHDNYLLKHLRAGSKEDSNLSGPACL